ncbi:unnamed protein product [Symbiodinium pilosum]|uniref:Uncharacterized protein n=1 Tax=Symbiodinium pilosum TaxID=2952 RepID=A0A812SHC7_SYMPI|nr:unnamed protein product [Symbiodinium pilosum]
MDEEKEKVRAECGEPAGMEDKMKKMLRLNELREKWSDQVFQDNPNSVNSFMITTDSNSEPAIEIGVDPSASKDDLVIPAEISAENVIFSTVGKPTHGFEGALIGDSLGSDDESGA